MLSKVGDVHGCATRAARSGLFLSTRDQQSVGYRVPVEWAALTEAQRGSGSLSAFKGGSRGGFLASYGSSVCQEAGCEKCHSPMLHSCMVPGICNLASINVRGILSRAHDSLLLMQRVHIPYC